MNELEDIQRLERRLDALRLEHAVRSADIRAKCREQLASPGALVAAGVLGVALGLLGGSRGRATSAPPPPSLHGGHASLFGGLVALAGLAGAALRLVELGLAVQQADTHRDS